jgi:hypothetical protein
VLYDLDSCNELRVLKGGATSLIWTEIHKVRSLCRFFLQEEEVFFIKHLAVDDSAGILMHVRIYH